MPFDREYSHALQPVMIPKKFLQHGDYYAGKCRNAVVARWDAHKDCFTHWRTKFAATFLEDINYWTPDGQYDEFMPIFRIGNTLPEPIRITPTHDDPPET